MARRTPAPSEVQDRFIIRFPDGLRAKIEAASDLNNRSINAEIIARLLQSFDPASASSHEADMTNKLADHEDRISKLETAVLNMLFADDDDPKG